MVTEQSSIGDKVIETLAKECLLSQTLFEKWELTKLDQEQKQNKTKKKRKKKKQPTSTYSFDFDYRV